MRRHRNGVVGQNVTAAFDTGQARGAALVACAQHGLSVGEFTPRQIRRAVVGEGTAEKEQVQYMVRQILGLRTSLVPTMRPTRLRRPSATSRTVLYARRKSCDCVFERNNGGQHVESRVHQCERRRLFRRHVGNGFVAPPQRGSEVMVYTHLSVREDAMVLYGFLSQEAHALFLRLIGVSGVGPKVALAALSTFKPEELVSAIQSQDVKAVSNIPGVGKKTAQRLILELKGTLAEEAEGNLFSAQIAEASARLQGARDALLWIGLLFGRGRPCFGKMLPNRPTRKGRFCSMLLKGWVPSRRLFGKLFRCDPPGLVGLRRGKGIR